MVLKPCIQVTIMNSDALSHMWNGMCTMAMPLSLLAWPLLPMSAKSVTIANFPATLLIQSWSCGFGCPVPPLTQLSLYKPVTGTKVWKWLQMLTPLDLHLLVHLLWTACPFQLDWCKLSLLSFPKIDDLTSSTHNIQQHLAIFLPYQQVNLWFLPHYLGIIATLWRGIKQEM